MSFAMNMHEKDTGAGSDLDFIESPNGSLLFLLHLLSKMRPSDEGGSRFGIVLNGTPLFKGDAGNGEGDIYEYFEREVKPHVPDAWINDEVRDEKDGKIGKLGYEISFNRHFYVYKPLDLWKRSKRTSRLWSPE
jgi:hypothetical protein